MFNKNRVTVSYKPTKFVPQHFWRSDLFSVSNLLGVFSSDVTLYYISHYIVPKKHLFPRSELRWPWPCPLRPSWRQDGNGWQRAPQLEMNKNPTSGEVTREISTDGDMSGYFCLIMFNHQEKKNGNLKITRKVTVPYCTMDHQFFSDKSYSDTTFPGEGPPGPSVNLLPVVFRRTISWKCTMNYHLSG